MLFIIIINIILKLLHEFLAHIFVANKLFGQLLEISLCEIEVRFTDQNSVSLTYEVKK